MDTLQTLRARAGLTQYTLANDINVQQSTINAVELGKGLPRPRTRVKLERYFGPIDWIGTQLQGMAHRGERPPVLDHILVYLQHSTMASRREKIRLLRQFLKEYEKAIRQT